MNATVPVLLWLFPALFMVRRRIDFQELLPVVRDALCVHLAPDRIAPDTGLVLPPLCSGVFTAALFLLPSIFMLFIAARDLHFGWQTVVLSSLTGTIIAGANLSFMHRAMPTFAGWLDQFARER
jgi:hypothetical protein